MKSKKNKPKGRKLGWFLCIIQGLITAGFIAGLLILDLLPMKITMPIIVLLILFWIIPFANHMVCKRRVWAGRILSIFMSVILLCGSAYVAKAQGMLTSISDTNGKVDKMVVAVLNDDPAKNIKDTKGYSFGIQLALKPDDTEKTVESINKKLDTKIETKEFDNLTDQVTALYEREVKAVIFNEAYMSVIKEHFSDFEDKIRIIYTYEIVSQLDNSLEVTTSVTEPFSIYLSGIDVAGAIETTGRSDVNIIAVVNPETHQVLLVTTPRDYHVVIPGISKGMPDKLTHAGIYGVDASMATLSNLYDVEVDYYVRVNFTSLPQIVDALGGVEVVSEYEFTTHPDSGEVMHVNKGVNSFNGKQALVFARERQNVPGGDFQRGKDQQAVITAMMKKAISPAILSGAFDIIDSVSANVDTNMPPKFIKGLVKSQISNPSSWQVTSMAAEGTPASGTCFSAQGSKLSICLPDDTSIANIRTAIDKVIAGEPLENAEIIEDHTEKEIEE